MKKYTKALEKEIERIKKTGMVSESFITGFEAATNRIRNMEELPTPATSETKEIERLEISKEGQRMMTDYEFPIYHKLNQVIDALNALRREGGEK